MNVIYEVNVQVDRAIETIYLAWLGTHMGQILRIEGFVSATLYEIREPRNERAGFCCQYRLRDQAALDNYLSHHAEAMRADATTRFGDRISANRRILHKMGTDSVPHDQSVAVT